MQRRSMGQHEYRSHECLACLEQDAERLANGNPPGDPFDSVMI